MCASVKITQRRCCESVFLSPHTSTLSHLFPPPASSLPQPSHLSRLRPSLTPPLWLAAIWPNKAMPCPRPNKAAPPGRKRPGLRMARAAIAWRHRSRFVHAPCAVKFALCSTCWVARPDSCPQRRCRLLVLRVADLRTCPAFCLFHGSHLTGTLRQKSQPHQRTITTVRAEPPYLGYGE